eukprot:CAMPEP_0198123352 /NCGR_PEP_ID=MMETSP1442-20131203/37302_1 /TAXON_ID= /ORGANISM="Craspedostauros australis, Strain CCMP3328" /LENGTH=237 /DNA_ID=CAMNT_0043782547 /DNA_START=176 /DNA_END=889 /DNA_ORIENTATION=-
MAERGAKTTVIEVCQGPDCFGGGGGAVLLDIEELVQEHFFLNPPQLNQQACHSTKCGTQNDVANSSSSSSDDSDTDDEGPLPYRVVRGGCRNQCAVGPNVHIVTKHPRHGKRSSFQHRIHIPSVQDLEICQTVAQQAGLGSDADRAVEPGIMVKMLRKRAARLRWELLRDMARYRARRNKNKKSDAEALYLQYSEFAKTERSANRPEAEAVRGRTERRLQHLDGMIRNMTGSKDEQG